MEINPNLVSIIPASELPTGVPTSAGQFFFYEGNEMKKSPMSEIYGLVSDSKSIGTITPSSTIPTDGNVWGFAGEGTYPNADNITVAAGKFAILSRVGTTWSLIAADLPQPIVNNVTNNNSYTVDPEQIVPSEALYTDDTLAGDILKRVDKATGENVNYRETITWYDGTSMTDSKVDGDLYTKKGFKYYRRVIDKDGELFLEKDTMAQMRALTPLEILCLKAGVYKGIKLNGYYTKGDTPASINYYISLTSATDDGGSIIEVGGIKLEHDFKGLADIRYFGAKCDGINNDTIPFKNALNNSETIYVPIGVTIIREKIIISDSKTLLGQIYDYNTSIESKCKLLFDSEDGGIFVQNRFFNIENITLECTYEDVDYHGLEFYSANDSSVVTAYTNVRNVFIKGFLDGIHTQRAFIMNFERVLSWMNKRDGIFIQSCTTTTMTNCFNNLNGRYGYNFDFAKYTALYNCASDGNAEYGYNASGCESILFSGCGTESNKYGGIRLQSSYASIQSFFSWLNGISQPNTSQGTVVYAWNSKVDINGLYERDADINAISPSITFVGDTIVFINNINIKRGSYTTSTVKVTGTLDNEEYKLQLPTKAVSLGSTTGKYFPFTSIPYQSNTGNSCIYGDGAGGLDDFTGKSQTFFGTNCGRLSNASSNCAYGYSSFYSTTTGELNTAFGSRSLYSNVIGSNNSANGYESLFGMTEGSNNIGFGYKAGGYLNNGNPATSLYRSIYLGADTKPSKNGVQNEIVIGYNTEGKGGNTVIIGNNDILKTYINGDLILNNQKSLMPSTPTSTGIKGTILFDSSYIYICVDNNTWRRAELATWS